MPINGIETAYKDRYTFAPLSQRAVPIQWYTLPPRFIVTEVTYYRWRQEYGGLKSDQVKRLKEFETENARLRKAVSDLTLEKLILKEAASGNW